jgi:soluble P-type ATPase
MTDKEKAMRHDSFIQLLDDQLEVDLYAVEAEAKSATWTRQMIIELKARAELFVTICDMLEDENLIGKAQELHTKVNDLRA